MKMIPYMLLLVIVAFQTGAMHPNYGVILFGSIIVLITLSCTFAVKHSKAKAELWLSAVNWVRVNNTMCFETRDLLGNSITNNPKCCPPPSEWDVVFSSRHRHSRDYNVLNDVRVQERDKSLQAVEISLDGVTYFMEKSHLLDIFVPKGVSLMSSFRRTSYWAVQLGLQLFWGALALVLTMEGSLIGCAMIVLGINFRQYFENELSASLAQKAGARDWNDVVTNLSNELSPAHK